MATLRNSAPGEEFRDDLRPLAATSLDSTRPGAGNAAARRALTPEELSALTQLNDWRSLASLLLTLTIIGLAVAFGLAMWPSPWIALSVFVIGVQQHALFILAHESAHY